MSKFVQGMMGFCIGAGIIVGLEFLLYLLMQNIFNARLIPKGLGWVVLPILGGTTGWKFGSEVGIDGLLNSFNFSTETGNKNLRLWLALSLVWIIGVSGYFLAFHPWGGYWNHGEYNQFLFLLLGPSVLGFVAIFAISWALRGK